MFAGRGRFARTWRLRRRARRNDAGSMPLAMLVTLVSVTLSAGLTSLVVGQISDSKREADRVSAVNAAQAGLDAGLAKIRSAFDATGGRLDKLPCTTLPQGSLTGAGAVTPTYTASIGYFLVDPSSLIETVRPIGDLTNLTGLVSTNLTTPLTNLVGNTLTLTDGLTVTLTGPLKDAVNSAVGCVSGVLTQVPLFGLLRSVGKVGGVSRTLYATYTFRNLNETIPGGKLVINGTSKALCIGSTESPPAATKTVKAVNCNFSNPTDPQTTFIYPKNLSLQLSNTRSATYPYGLCVTAPTVQAAGLSTTFEACSPTSNTLQQWDYDVNKQTYYGATLKIVAGVLTPQRSNFCLGMATPSVTPGGNIVLKNGGDCGNANVFGKSFVPDNTVGAGGAGIESSQYVNKDEVGRCLDLTNEQPNGNWAKSIPHAPALISYPCKQSLNGLPYWNHVWVGPLSAQMIKDNVTSAVGQVYSTDKANKQWCMLSPGVNGGWVWVSECDAADINQKWTVYGATTLINEAYQVKDNYGHCLEAAAHRGPDYVFGGKWSYIIATDCTGKAEQKWNAPTDPKLAPLKSIQER